MVRLEYDGRLAVMTLDRPPANTFDEEQLEALAAAVSELEAGSRAGALLLRGEGPRFSAGADISMIATRFGTPDGADRMADFAGGLQVLFARIESLPIPSVAAIRGAATGGGLELALACDLRVAAEDARLGLPEVKIGLVPGAGGSQRLTRLAGPAVALRVILRAELLSGSEAQRLGVVQWAVPAAEVDSFARTLAEELAGMSGPALAATKRCIAAFGSGHGFETEIEVTRLLMGEPVTAQLVGAFLDRRRIIKEEAS